jgi:hypothetical protein
MVESSTSVRRLTANERGMQALELRKAGVNFPTIAKQLGYQHASGAYEAVRAALKRTETPPADEMRVLACERLDRILFAVWKRALDINDPQQLDCIDRVLKIEQRRAKLLGLDAPDKVDIEWRIRLMARSLGFDESEENAAVQEAERYIREGQGRHAATL